MSTPDHGAHKSLPANPSLENLKKQAKRLSKQEPSLSLQQAQHQLARSYGCSNWDGLLAAVATSRKSLLDASPSTAAGLHARTLREGGKCWIEPIPLLEWNKTGQCTVIVSLAAALSVLDADPAPFVTPRTLTLAGSPAKTGPAWDYNTLMGDSAMAFRLRWHRRGGFRQTSAKPATWWAFTMAYAGGPEDEALLQRSTGWQFDGTPYFYPNNARPLDQFPKIRASIEAGLPVVACFPEEFGVIHGYDAQTNQLLITAYQKAGAAFWIPISEVGTKVLFLASHRTPITRVDATLAALNTAVVNWSRGHMPAREAGILWEDEAIQLQYGAAAYEEWVHDLRHADLVPPRSRQQLRNVNAFNMSCLKDARWAAAGYLRSAKKMLPDYRAAHLVAAADIYEELARQTTELQNVGVEFFGVWSGKLIEDWSADLREREAVHLERYAELDAAAIAEIRRAIEGIAIPEH